MADPGNSNLLHSALRSPTTPLSVSTILACPLPFPFLPPEKLLPELGHELKTPLTGIMGLAQVMQRSSSGERSAQYADLIYQKSQQLLTAINDLLDLTQLCTQQFVLQLQSVEFYSVFDTALQSVQRMSGRPLTLQLPPKLKSDAQRPEQWITADRARVEQLLIHLLGYLSLQKVESLTLRTVSWGPWMKIALRASTLTLSDGQLASLGWSSQASDAALMGLAHQSGTVLKFVLARRLAQLQGGEVSCRSSPQLGTEVGVLFPRDLTGTTAPSQPDFKSAWIILAQQSAVIEEVVRLLPADSPPTLIARSLVEAQEKIQMVSPAVLMIDGQMVEDMGLDIFQEWLNQWLSRQHRPLRLVWVGRPSLFEILDLFPSEVWQRPLAAYLPEALDFQPAQSPEQAQRDSNSSQPAAPSRPLTLLQLDTPSSTAFISPAVRSVLEEISSRYNCSIVSVNDVSQAELLVRIWKPEVIVCPETLPQWASQVLSTSLLATLPAFVLQSSDLEEVSSLGAIRPVFYQIQKSERSSASAQQLHQRLVKAAAQYSSDL